MFTRGYQTNISPEETSTHSKPAPGATPSGYAACLRENPEDLSDVWCDEEVLFDWATRAMGQAQLQWHPFGWSQGPVSGKDVHVYLIRLSKMILGSRKGGRVFFVTFIFDLI